MATKKAAAKKTAAKRKPGRPSGFTQAIADKVCTRIANGESLRTICRDEKMPAVSSVCKWLGQHSAFAEQYARAREAQADTLFDEILEIADETAHDFTEDRQGNTVVNNETIARSRLRVDARKWMAAKLKPKVYGDKTIVAGDADAPLEVRTKAHEMDEAALLAIAAQALQKK